MTSVSMKDIARIKKLKSELEKYSVARLKLIVKEYRLSTPPINRQYGNPERKRPVKRDYVKHIHDTLTKKYDGSLKSVIEEEKKTENPDPIVGGEDSILKSAATSKDPPMYRNECVFCLDYIKKDACVAKCFHMFHYSCIKPWLRINKNCPTCRTKITSVERIKFHNMSRPSRNVDKCEKCKLEVFCEKFDANIKNITGQNECLIMLVKNHIKENFYFFQKELNDNYRFKDTLFTSILMKGSKVDKMTHGPH